MLCALPRDQEVFYGPSSFLSVTVHYRVLGGAPGRLVCTLFVGSTTQQVDPAVTVTANGPLVSGGTRSSVFLQAQYQMVEHLFQPNTLVCAISPKTSLGPITVEEEESASIG